MDLKLFFSPISEDLSSASYPTNALYRSIYVFADTMPDIRNMHIALIGLDEIRGDAELIEGPHPADNTNIP